MPFYLFLSFAGFVAFGESKDVGSVMPVHTSISNVCEQTFWSLLIRKAKVASQCSFT